MIHLYDTHLYVSDSRSRMSYDDQLICLIDQDSTLSIDNLRNTNISTVRSLYSGKVTENSFNNRRDENIRKIEFIRWLTKAYCMSKAAASKAAT